MKRSNLLPRAIVWGLCAAASLALSSPASAADGSWATKSPMPTARSALAVGVVNGKLVAVGGPRGEVILLDAETAIERVTLAGPGSPSVCLLFSPCGQRLFAGYKTECRLWTVPGENAGRQTAMYSAPSGPGVL